MLLSWREIYPCLENPVFFHNDIRVNIQKGFAIESDVTNNAKPVCNHAK